MRADQYLSKSRSWIFFDLDDTIIPSSELYTICYKKLKLDKDPLFNRARLELKHDLPLGHTSSHNRFLYFKRYLELQKKFSPSALFKLNDRYENLLEIQIRSYLKKSYRLTILKKLAEKHNLAIITNENCRTQILKINTLDPKGKLFRFVLTSEDIGKEKPNKEIFYKALELANITCKDALLVGDSIKNDYTPARSIGMRAILTEEFIKHQSSLKLNKISRLEDLLKLP